MRSSSLSSTFFYSASFFASSVLALSNSAFKLFTRVILGFTVSLTSGNALFIVSMSNSSRFTFLGKIL